jgi:hypothetical protein
MKNVTPKNNQHTNEVDFENSFENDIFSKQETGYPSVEMLDNQGLMRPEYGTNKESTLE